MKKRAYTIETKYIPTSHRKLKILVVRPDRPDSASDRASGETAETVEPVLDEVSLSIFACEPNPTGTGSVPVHASAYPTPARTPATPPLPSSGSTSAALYMLVRDRSQVKIAFQMPLYPMLDDRDTERKPKHNTASGYGHPTKGGSKFSRGCGSSDQARFYENIPMAAKLSRTNVRVSVANLSLTGYTFL